MAPPPAAERVRQLVPALQNLIRAPQVNPVLLAAFSNQPEQIELLSSIGMYRWEDLKTVKHETHGPEGIAAVLDNLEFVQFWAGLALANEGTLPGSIWTHACMGPSLRTMEWLLENHMDTIFTNLKATDAPEGQPDVPVPPQTMAECLRHKKLVARAICFVLDAIEHAPKVYTNIGRDDRAERAEAAIRLIRDHCANANRRDSPTEVIGRFGLNQRELVPTVFSKTPLRHAALYGSPKCFEIILASTNVANPASLFDALFPHFERNSFRDNNFRFSTAFLRFLTYVIPEEDRCETVQRYLPKAKLYFKDVAFFRYLISNDFIFKDANLVSYVLSLEPHISYNVKYPRPILRRHMFRSLAFAAANSGISATDLAQIIHAVANPGPLHGANSLIRLALHYGADASVPIVRDAVRKPNHGLPANWGNLKYIGFDEDIKSVKYWDKWMTMNSFGGLPPELTNNILMWHWESLL